MMNSKKHHPVVSLTVVALLLFIPPAWAADGDTKHESVDPDNFQHSTTIDNEWLPFKPGMRYVWDGMSVDDEGDEEAQSVVFTVTDLTKVIAGVRTVVCLDRDIVARELEEAEIFFAAQDDDGNVWLMGEYPEEYDGGEFVDAPCWIHGVNDAKAGILMLGEPKLGTRSYSQGWAPSAGFTDRATVYKMGEKTTVPFGDYDDVLVIEEYNEEEPGAFQLKYHARGVGSVRIGWRGAVTDQETLELVRVEQLSAEELAKARNEALKLEQRAYEISKDVYGRTKPLEHVSNSSAAE